MGLLEILKNEFFSTIYFLPFFILVGVIILKKINKINFTKLAKAIQKAERKKSSELEIEIIKNDEINEKDFLGFNDKNIENEINLLKKQFNENDGLIKVDFAKAWYIVRNFKDYNMLSNEDGKIIFEKLKKQIDIEENISEEISSEAKLNTKDSISMSPSSEVDKLINLGNGKFKRINSNGYIVIENGLVVEVVNYNEKESKEEKAVEKLKQIEENFIKTENEKKEKKKKRKIMEEVEEHDENKKTDEINNLIASLKGDEPVVEKETAEKKIIFEENDFEKVDVDNLIFLLEDFSDYMKLRKKILLLNLLNYKNLIDKESGLILTDIDTEKKILYINVFLFLKLISKFYANENKVLSFFLNSSESVNLIEVKKIVQILNTIFRHDYGKDLFKGVGRLKDYVMQRDLIYNFENDEKVISSQMIMLDINVDDSFINEEIKEIKKHIIAELRPKIFKIRLNSSKEISIINNKNLK